MTIIRQTTLAALTLMLVLTMASQVFAAKCVAMTQDVRFGRAAAVVVARVEAVAPLDAAVLEARAVVERRWKGDAPANIVVRTEGSDAVAFAPGQAFLLYLEILPDGAYATGRCAGTLPVVNAAEQLRWLDVHKGK